MASTKCVLSFFCFLFLSLRREGPAKVADNEKRKKKTTQDLICFPLIK